MDLYIYYRVPCSHADALQEQVQTMQAMLAKKYKIITELKRRPEPSAERHTWMEVYRNIPENFDTVLDIAVTKAGLPQLIDGERHAEYFLDLSACA